MFRFSAFLFALWVSQLYLRRRDVRHLQPTLAIVKILYSLVAIFGVRAVPLKVLATSDAPVSLLYETLTGASPLAITIIAIMATMNGVVIILEMASPVVYGMARKGRLPPWLVAVSPRTHTPLTATMLVSATALLLALLAPLDKLAEMFSQVLLVVFCLANLSLLRMKLRVDPVPVGGVTVPTLVPILGAVSCLGLLSGTGIQGA